MKFKVWQLTKNLTRDTECTIIDHKSGTIYIIDNAGTITDRKIEDKVKDWDFSNGHIIYI